MKTEPKDAIQNTEDVLIYGRGTDREFVEE